MRITVFTPTFNRGYIIRNLYDSLKKQTFRDFEWVVVDDGSTDDTESIFETIKSEQNDFPIRYYYTENGGKHRAINFGVRVSKGDLFFIVDSDDYLTPTSLEIINKYENSISSFEKGKFAGVCGLKGKDETHLLGSSFQGDYIDITALEREKNNIYGDKSEVFYTNILKKYPFPEFDNEKFLTESVVWDKIAYDGYKMRFFNEIIYICDYLDDGLTANIKLHHHNSPKGTGLYIYQCCLYGKLFGINKWHRLIGYYYEYRDELSFSEIASNLNMNKFKLYFRFLGMKIFYKLYDR